MRGPLGAQGAHDAAAAGVVGSWPVWGRRRRNKRWLVGRRRDQRRICDGVVWKRPWQENLGQAETWFVITPSDLMD